MSSIAAVGVTAAATVDQALALVEAQVFDAAAAKVDRVDEAYFRDAIAPLIEGGGVEFVGEINEREKPKFLGEAAALRRSWRAAAVCADRPKSK